MYNDTGLQTAGGSRTNGRHVETNRRTIEPDTKMLIAFKVYSLEEELHESKRFTAAQITARGAELRKKLEAEAAAKMLGAQTHQVAAPRKNKVRTGVIGKLRAAFAFYCTGSLIKAGKRDAKAQKRHCSFI